MRVRAPPRVPAGCILCKHPSRRIMPSSSTGRIPGSEPAWLEVRIFRGQHVRNRWYPRKGSALISTSWLGTRRGFPVKCDLPGAPGGLSRPGVCVSLDTRRLPAVLPITGRLAPVAQWQSNGVVTRGHPFGPGRGLACPSSPTAGGTRLRISEVRVRIPWWVLEGRWLRRKSFVRLRLS